MQITQQIGSSTHSTPQYQKSPDSTEDSKKVNNIQLEQQSSEGSLGLPSKEQVEAQINGINKVLEMNMTSLKFNLHEETDRYYVEVQDQKTKEVIKEIPTKEFLDLMARITEYTGIFMDLKV